MLKHIKQLAQKIKGAAIEIGRKVQIVWRSILQRKRLSLNNTRDNREIWYTHISIANLFMATVTATLLMFVFVLTLVGYSPVLEVLPGYRSESVRSRQNIIDNILRLDSMERVINDMMIYNDNIALIMDGKISLMGSYSSRDSISLLKTLVNPNAIDSTLRSQIEGQGRYSLKMGNAAIKAPMIAPVDGIITKRFDIVKANYGMEFAVARGERVMATQKGVVTLVLWSPASGYTIQIMHPNNLMSIYSNVTKATIARGTAVKEGQVIGYSDHNEMTAKGAAEEPKNKPITFELWSEGKPVNPERYITF